MVAEINHGQQGWLTRGVIARSAEVTLDSMQATAAELPHITVDMDWFGSRGYVLPVRTEELPAWARSLVPESLPEAYRNSPRKLVVAMETSRDNDGRRGGLIDIRLIAGDFYEFLIDRLHVSAHSVAMYGSPAGVSFSAFRAGQLMAGENQDLVPATDEQLTQVDALRRNAMLARAISADLLDLFQSRRSDAYTQYGHAYSSLPWAGLGTAVPVYGRIA